MESLATPEWWKFRGYRDVSRIKIRGVGWDLLKPKMESFALPLRDLISFSLSQECHLLTVKSEIS